MISRSRQTSTADALLKGSRARVAELLGIPGSTRFATLRRLVAVVRRARQPLRFRADADVTALAGRIRGESPASIRSAPAATLVEPLALACEAAARALGLEPFDEQLLTALALTSGAGAVVEFDTGEGKTLAGALAAASSAVLGRRVHVVSVNDYLARRDAEALTPFYALLGLTVGWLGQQSGPDARRHAYACDVTYVSVSELGFDTLRDRFALTDAERVSPVFDVAIVDEADSVMIDEATSPLVLATDADEAPSLAVRALALTTPLEAGVHFEVDADGSVVNLTDAGVDAVESQLASGTLFDDANLELLTQVNLALHARVLVRRDVDYLVEGGGIRLIAPSRGRIADRQRWPDGLHAAVEAKEGLALSRAGSVLDTITVHELLGRYETLSGMSGTVLTVANDLIEFYGARSGRVDRRVPNRRVDAEPHVFAHRADADRALVAEVARLHAEGRPVLVATPSVARSEALASQLAVAGIRPIVLNAKNDRDEAAVVARAGVKGAVTISTQMSGRGVDIVLGGASAGPAHDEVVALGGLAIVAAGRFTTRRLDAQLRGRAGRQGDPGTSSVFASLDDDLVAHNAPAHIAASIARSGGAPDARQRQRIVDQCQRVAEGIHLDRQRATHDYHAVVSEQRARVLRQRDLLLGGSSAAVDPLRPAVAGLAREVTGNPHTHALDGMLSAILVHHLDRAWQNHLANLAEVRDGIHLRSLGGEVPSEQFTIVARRGFEYFFDDVLSQAEVTVAALVPSDLGQSLERLGLKRPSSTWTYMLTDNPLGSAHERMLRGFAVSWRRQLGLE